MKNIIRLSAVFLICSTTLLAENSNKQSAGSDQNLENAEAQLLNQLNVTSDNVASDDQIPPPRLINKTSSEAGLAKKAFEKEKKGFKKQISSQSTRIRSLNTEVSKLKKQLNTLQTENRKIKKEMTQTRQSLMVAETENERLIHIIDKNADRSISTFLKKKPKPAAAPQRRVVTPQKKSIPSGSEMPIATVTVDKANLRAGPGKEHSPLMTIARGTRLVVEKRKGTWYRVLAPTGQRAWVSASVVAFGRNRNSSPSSTVNIRGYKE